MSHHKKSNMDEHKQLQQNAKCNIASAMKYFPFKGIDKFYDLGSLMIYPEIFQSAVDIMAKLTQSYNPTHVAALDARGFLLAAPIALKLNLPLVMIRKKGKMPNTVATDKFEIEYGTRDGVEMQIHTIGDVSITRLVLIDDLVATGGTLGSSIQCAAKLQIEVVGCVSMIELDAFKHIRDVALGEVPHCAIFDNEGEMKRLGCRSAILPSNYKDTGKQFENPKVDTLRRV